MAKKYDSLACWFVVMLLAVSTISHHSMADSKQALQEPQEPTGTQPSAAFAVTNTNDSGPGSLRQALLDARNNPGSDTIFFNIPSTGATLVIKPTTPLPALDTGGVTIDGTTQPNLNPNGPEVFLDMSSAGSGLKIQSGNNIIRGIGIFRSPQAGIEISGSGVISNLIEGCYLGTNSDGTGAQANRYGILITNGSAANFIGSPTSAGRNIISGNTEGGVVIEGTGTTNNLVRNNVIGLNRTASSPVGNAGGGIIIRSGASNNTIGGIGTSDGNFIGGNAGSAAGILISDVGSNSNTVQGNFIGTNSTRGALGNGGAGIRIVTGASLNLIGGALPGAGNVIAFNNRDGITVGTSFTDLGTQRNTLSRNLIFGNSSLGIDLADDSTTSNDPSDLDMGPNGLQNKPVISSVVTSGSNLVISGQVDTPDSRTTVELFANFTSPANQQFLTQVAIAANGNFTATVPTPASGFKISGTATDSLGNTSEFSASVSLSKQPDLNIQSLTVTPTTVTAGNNVTVTFNVKNEGAADIAITSTAAIVLSADNQITTQDTLLATLLTPPLASGKTTTLTASVTIPANTPPSSLFIGVIADSGGSVDESDETDNTSSKSIKIVAAKADLAVGGLSLSTSSISPGDSLTVNLTVTNQGDQTAGASTTQVRLSTNSTINTSDPLLASVNTSAISSDSSLPLTINVTIPSGTKPGNYFVGVMLDATNAVDEADEKNNTLSLALTVTGLPDLVVDSLRVSPTSIAPGNSVTIDFTIRNQGASPAEATTNDVLFSNDNSIKSGEDLLLATRSTSALGAGETAAFSISVTIPANAAAGSRFIGIVADSSKAVDEANENNNTKAAALAIQDQTPPTVSIITPKGGEGLAAGRTFTIQWTAGDNVGITSQELRFSADGGATFPTQIATGITPGVTMFQWSIPVVNITTARVQIIAKDGAGNTGTASSAANFTIAPPPTILTAKLKTTGKLILTTTNVQPGATLRVVVGIQTETFTPVVSEGKTVVKPTAVSTPGGKTISQLLPTGTAAAFVLVNPNGVTSDPFGFTR